MKHGKTRPLTKAGGLLTAVLLGVLGLFLPASAAYADSTPALEDGDSVYVGQRIAVSGSAMIFPVWKETPADLDNPGEPDFWAYCIEQTVSAQHNRAAIVGGLDSFLGDNYFTDPEVQSKVLWVLAHSYPTLSAEALGTAAGISGFTVEEAISATTTAVWRYTDVTWDASYHWISDNAEAVYWHLVNGANASAGMTPADFETNVSIIAPAAAQTAGTLVGPFVVSTNRPTASVSTDPALTVTDENGVAVDASAVADGQEIYLDLRGGITAGSAVVTASASGSSATGMVISVPNVVGGTPTADDHGQSVILVAPGTAVTTADAAVQWSATSSGTPGIGTSLVDAADGDRVLPWNGGTVIDTVAYENLVPGAEYTLVGELMRKSDGSGTGITGSVTFTPTDASGEVDVLFTVPVGFSGEDLVAFEWLFEGSAEGDVEDAVAEHTDIDDPAQTVTIEEAPAMPAPVIGTSLVDAADGDRVLPWNGGTVIDTVAYQNLTVGIEYTLIGELMDKADGTATGITGTATFTPATAHGEVAVVFVVPEGYAGGTLVAFEWLYEGSDTSVEPVAEHTDIDDPAQTVTIEEESAVAAPGGPGDDELSDTGAEAPTVLLALAFCLVALGSLLLMRRKAAS